jgi:hypothetical protein
MNTKLVDLPTPTQAIASLFEALSSATRPAGVPSSLSADSILPSVPCGCPQCDPQGIVSFQEEDTSHEQQLEPMG